jgi:hypothetical protein
MYLHVYLLGNPEKKHEAVPEEEVKWLHDFIESSRDNKVSFRNALLLLRRKLFPFAHSPHTWVKGTAL